MKKSICLFLLICISCRVSAQTDTIAHIIERGESIEYLAERYKTSVDEIKQCNPLFEEFFTGLEINIPIPKQNAMTSAGATQYNSYYASLCQQADDLLRNGEYKKAEKAYSKLIKNYSSSFTCTDAYYGRALAYYNRGKWKSAISDFEYVLDDTSFSASARSQCEDLLEEAKKNREQQLEERGQMWAGIIGAVVQTAGNAYMESQGFVDNSNFTPSVPVYQYQQNTMPIIQTPTYVPTTPTFDWSNVNVNSTLAVDWSNVNWNNVPTGTYVQSNVPDTGTSYTTTGSGNSTYSSSTSSPCKLCHGMKSCWTCNGSRRYLNPLTNEYITCPNCTNGLCSACGGTGIK